MQSDLEFFSGRPPTCAERRRFKIIRETGCIICLIYHQVKTPPQIHHIEGKTKKNAHKSTLGLCYWHHLADQEKPAHWKYTSRHPNKAAFEQRYMPESDLLVIQDKVIKKYEQLRRENMV